MKYATLLVATILMVSCANSPQETESSVTILGLDSITEQLPVKEDESDLMRRYPLSGLVTRVLQASDGGVRLDAGREDGVKPYDTFAVFNEGESCGAWRVYSAGPNLCDCFLLGARSRQPEPGDVGVLARWVDRSGRSHGASQDGTAMMPFASHPFGPWSVDGSRQGTRVWSETVCFVGRMTSRRAGPYAEIETLWGDPARVRGPILVRHETTVLKFALTRDDGEVYARLDELDKRQRAVYDDMPEGRLLVGFSRGLDLHGDGAMLRVPGGPDTWHWRRDETKARGPVSVSINRILPRHLRGARVEVWRGELFVGYATPHAGRPGQNFVLDVPAYHGARIKGGEVIGSIFWHETTPVSVALHGTLDADAPMSREEFEHALRQAGCEVHSKAGPTTKVVILGANLLDDEHYRDVRRTLHFQTVSDDVAANYFK